MTRSKLCLRAKLATFIFETTGRGLTNEGLRTARYERRDALPERERRCQLRRDNGRHHYGAIRSQELQSWCSDCHAPLTTHAYACGNCCEKACSAAVTIETACEALQQLITTVTTSLYSLGVRLPKAAFRLLGLCSIPRFAVGSTPTAHARRFVRVRPRPPWV